MAKPVTTIVNSSRTLLFSALMTTTTKVFGFRISSSVFPQPTSSVTAVSASAAMAAAIEQEETSSSITTQHMSAIKEDTTDSSLRCQKQVLFDTIQSCLTILMNKNKEQDDTTATAEEANSIAQFVQDSMSMPNRNYHCLSHVLYVALYDDDAIYQLAGLFHDVIYTNIDGVMVEETLSRQQAELLKDVIHKDGKKKKHIPQNDTHLQMVLEIFGIPSTYQDLGDEFLSALVAVRLLQPYLSLKQLVQIVVCIEATIPFRPPSAISDLYERLVQVNHDLDIGLSQEQCHKAIERAIKMANRDVDNFAYENPALFLDKTWMLLSELNQPLRSHRYTAAHYQHAILKMHGFFQYYLNPNYIFKSYRDVTCEEQTLLAIKNVEIAKQYMSAKLLSAAIVASMALLLNKEKEPLSTLLGSDWTDKMQTTEEAEEAANTIHNNKSSSNVGNYVDIEQAAVYKILQEGRVAETDFDIRQSPLAAWLYAKLGNKAIQELLSNNTVNPITTNEHATKLLQALPNQIQKHVVHMLLDQMARNDDDEQEQRINVLRQLGLLEEHCNATTRIIKREKEDGGAAVEKQ